MFSSECSFSRLVKLKKAEFTDVIEHFFDKRNEELNEVISRMPLNIYTL